MIGCAVYGLVAVFRLNKKEQEQAKPLEEQQVVKDNRENNAGKAAAVEEDNDVEMMDGPYGRAPYGGVIWDDEYSIDELIFKNGVYYYNEHSEEWEEDDEDA
ncbi:MAG: hypothetical protein ACI3XC_09445 [Phascolarctobacterium sp.]